MGDFAQESGHWYKSDGSPCYTTTGANGKTRPTTLRDARKLNLYPSVTGIIRLAAAEGLQRWILQQAILSALTLPRIEGETSDAFMERVEVDRRAQTQQAADRGTQIHAAIEQHYRKEAGDVQFMPWVAAAVEEIDAICGPQVWKPERSFASSRGYGGKLDLHSGEWVLDIKTKDGELPKSVYDEAFMQLSAYRDGILLPGARCGILYVRRDEPQAVLIEASAEDLDKGWECFKALLHYGQAKNRYRPGDQT